MPKALKAEDRPNMELMLARLEHVAERLSAGETTLEQAGGLYEEGMELVKRCRDQLKSARSKVQKLNRLTGKLESFKYADE